MVLEDIFEIIKDRKENGEDGSYTKYLFDKGTDKILKKVGEECTEVIIAAKGEDKNEIVNENNNIYNLFKKKKKKNCLFRILILVFRFFVL